MSAAAREFLIESTLCGGALSVLFINRYPVLILISAAPVLALGFKFCLSWKRQVHPVVDQERAGRRGLESHVSPEPEAEIAGTPSDGSTLLEDLLRNFANGELSDSSTSSVDKFAFTASARDYWLDSECKSSDSSDDSEDINTNRFSVAYKNRLDPEWVGLSGVTDPSLSLSTKYALDVIDEALGSRDSSRLKTPLQRSFASRSASRTRPRSSSDSFHQSSQSELFGPMDEDQLLAMVDEIILADDIHNDESIGELFDASLEPFYKSNEEQVKETFAKIRQIEEQEEREKRFGTWTKSKSKRREMQTMKLTETAERISLKLANQREENSSEVDSALGSSVDSDLSDIEEIIADIILQEQKQEEDQEEEHEEEEEREEEEEEEEDEKVGEQEKKDDDHDGVLFSEVEDENLQLLSDLAAVLHEHDDDSSLSSSAAAAGTNKSDEAAY
jgi:hypothetical protein